MTWFGSTVTIIIGNEVIYLDLSKDETLFQGYGDYQFDVYRRMKDITR